MRKPCEGYGLPERFGLVDLYKSTNDLQDGRFRCEEPMSRLAVILGVMLLAFGLAAAPMPLTVTLENPSRNVTIYPNTLFAIPLLLLASLLLLYGITVKNPQDRNVG